MSSDALLLGRTTYEGFAEAWPSREGEFADKFNGMQKYVVSTTLAGSRVEQLACHRGDVAGEIQKLRELPGGDILVNGSAQLVSLLLDEGLIDELRLMVFPIVLGKGKRLFPDGIASTLAAARASRVRPARRSS